MVPTLVYAQARKKVAEEISDEKKEFRWARKKSSIQSDPHRVKLTWKNQDGGTADMSINVQGFQAPPLDGLNERTHIESKFKHISPRKEKMDNSPVIQNMSMQQMHENLDQMEQNKQRKLEKKALNNFFKIKELKEQKAMIEKAIDHYTEISFEDKDALPHFTVPSQDRFRYPKRRQAAPYLIRQAGLHSPAILDNKKAAKIGSFKTVGCTYGQAKQLDQFKLDFAGNYGQHELKQVKRKKILDHERVLNYDIREKERGDQVINYKKTPQFLKKGNYSYEGRDTAWRNVELQERMNRPIKVKRKDRESYYRQMGKQKLIRMHKKYDWKKEVESMNILQKQKLPQKSGYQFFTKDNFKDYEKIYQGTMNHLPTSERRQELPKGYENYSPIHATPQWTEEPKEKVQHTEINTYTDNLGKIEDLKSGKSNFHNISALIMQEHQNVQTEQSLLNWDNSPQLLEDKFPIKDNDISIWKNQDREREMPMLQSFDGDNMSLIPNWLNESRKDMDSSGASVDSMTNEAEDPNLDDVIEEIQISSDENDDNSTSEEELEEDEDADKASDDGNNEFDESLVNKVSDSNRANQKIAMPIKKRKRMRQMPYPKSRFISINKVPVFDLTVEEEFRIHDIDFRRFTEYNSFIKMMKQTLGSRYESFKKGIFSSAFELNKVVLDPQLHEEVYNLAVKNHSECVFVYEEIKAVPQEIWSQLCVPALKTWTTYTWSLCWANVDAVSLIEQETKAGFWDQEIQAIYDSLFPNNPTAVRSLSMEDWEIFVSPWASSHSEEEV